MSIEYTLTQDDIPDEQFAEIMDAVLETAIDLTPVATGYAASQWQLDYDTVSNDCEYIDYLEEGISDQARGGILSPLRAAVRDIVRSVMR